MDKIQEFGDKVFDFVMANYDKPLFWTGILVVMLIIMWGAIGSFDRK